MFGRSFFMNKHHIQFRFGFPPFTKFFPSNNLSPSSGGELFSRLNKRAKHRTKKNRKEICIYFHPRKKHYRICHLLMSCKNLLLRLKNGFHVEKGSINMQSKRTEFDSGMFIYLIDLVSSIC